MSNEGTRIVRCNVFASFYVIRIVLLAVAHVLLLAPSFGQAKIRLHDKRNPWINRIIWDLWLRTEATRNDIFLPLLILRMTECMKSLFMSRIRSGVGAAVYLLPRNRAIGLSLGVWVQGGGIHFHSVIIPTKHWPSGTVIPAPCSLKTFQETNPRQKMTPL